MRFYKLLLSLTCFLSCFVTLVQGQDQSLFNDCGVKGSVTVYDLGKNKWFYTDSLDANQETLPASTFKILNSLMALEYKAITDKKEIIKWDGIEKSHLGRVIPAWNKDSDLKDAFKNSTIWFYEEIAKRIGREKYIQVLKDLGYGNAVFTEKGVDFWNYGEFSISPKNQIEFLLKLYKGELPFSEKNQQTVRDLMVMEDIEGKIMRGKTGWTTNHGENIGWFVGYLTTNDNVLFFATRITNDVNSKNKNFGNCRVAITKQILASLTK